MSVTEYFRLNNQYKDGISLTKEEVSEVVVGEVQNSL
jgi:hypothetical protein